MKLSPKSANRVLAPEGVHAARCVRIIDLGTQHSATYNSDSRKIQFSFELVDETHVFDEEKGPQPFVLHRRYTASLSKKANLFKDIQAWLGVKLEKNAEFDVATLLNKPCQVQVVHNTGEDGTTYANIQSIMAPPKGAKIKNAETELTLFSLEPEEFDQDKFDELPDFLQETIEESPEYKALQEEAAPKKPATTTKKQPAKGPAKSKR